MRRLATQFGRFLVVGGVAFAIDYGGFLLLHTAIGAPYVLASAISLTLSVIVSYVLSVRFVFTVRERRNVPLEIALYVAITVVGILINQAVLLGCVAIVGMLPEVGKLVATAVVLVFNFGARKMLIERPYAAGDDADGSASG